MSKRADELEARLLRDQQIGGNLSPKDRAAIQAEIDEERLAEGYVETVDEASEVAESTIEAQVETVDGSADSDDESWWRRILPSAD